MKSSIFPHLIALHAQLQSASGPNAFTLRLPVPSNLNIPAWRSRLATYSDTHLCDFLEFGWPVGYAIDETPVSSARNHGSALSRPDVIDSYLTRECELGATCGPFSSNPLSNDLTTSPLQIAYSSKGKPRVVVDLSFPRGSSVNSGIPADTYLGVDFKLRLPGVDALLDIIRLKGRHCHLFKMDLSRAYRQLRVDPRDYHLLGFRHRNAFYFDIAPLFGLRSSAMMCQRSTTAITFMYRDLGFHCTNYIDDFGGAEIPDKSAEAFQTLGSLLEELGLDTSPEKASPPATSMVFLGVFVDTANMTVSVSPERVQELFDRCSSLLPVDNVSRTELQSLLGVMSYVTACVRPARVFMSTLLYTLRVHKLSSVCPLSPDNKADLRWWCYFLPFYNGVTIIKTVPWRNDPMYLSTDACSTGAGGFFNGQYFHTPFPSSVLHRFGHDINTLELLAIMVALKIWAPLLRGQRLVLQCDNENSVLALTSGRSRAPGMQRCLREIWFLTAAWDLEIVSTHIPGITNSIADHLSRWHLSPTHQQRFSELTSTLTTTHVYCPPEFFEFQISC